MPTGETIGDDLSDGFGVNNTPLPWFTTYVYLIPLEYPLSVLFILLRGVVLSFILSHFGYIKISGGSNSVHFIVFRYNNDLAPFDSK